MTVPSGIFCSSRVRNRPHTDARIALFEAGFRASAVQQDAPSRSGSGFGGRPADHVAHAEVFDGGSGRRCGPGSVVVCSIQLVREPWFRQTPRRANRPRVCARRLDPFNCRERRCCNPNETGLLFLRVTGGLDHLALSTGRHGVVRHHGRSPPRHRSRRWVLSAGGGVVNAMCQRPLHLGDPSRRWRGSISDHKRETRNRTAPIFGTVTTPTPVQPGSTVRSRTMSEPSRSLQPLEHRVLSPSGIEVRERPVEIPQRRLLHAG